MPLLKKEDFGMFIAMNRFRVAKGSEADFEHVWLSRDSHLDKGPSRRRSGSTQWQGENKPLYLDHPQFEGFEVPPDGGTRQDRGLTHT